MGRPWGPLVSALGDRFVLVREIGAGGMARVFLGRDEVLDRPVAIKILDPDLADPEVSPRFRREGRTAARLSHPNIVQVYDAGEEDLDGREVSFIVMEYVSGGDLQDLMDRNGPLPETMLSRVGAEVAAGLAHAHDRGVIHRDVKPRNVIIDEYGSPKLADFGIARALDAAGTTGGSSTTTGSYLGTASYSSPEQLRGEKITPKSDIYALGATLYHAAVGEPPFAGTPIEIASQQVSTRPTPPRERGARIGRRVERLILECLSKNAADRPDGAGVRERLAATGAVGTPSGYGGTPGGTPVGSGAGVPGLGGLTRAGGAAKAAGLAGAGAVGRGLQRLGGGRGGAEPTGRPEVTISVPRRTFRSGYQQRKTMAMIFGALVIAALLGVGAFALLNPGAQRAETPSGQVASRQGNAGEDGGQRAAAAGQGSGAQQAQQEGSGSTGGGNAAGGAQEEPSGPAPPPAAAEQAVFDMYVQQSYQTPRTSWAFLSERLQNEVGSPQAWAQREGIYTIYYVYFTVYPKATVSGDTARVDFTVRLDRDAGQELLSGTWVCVNEDGEWKLDRLENEQVRPA